MEEMTAELINKYLTGTATTEEKANLDVWYQSLEKQPALTPTLDKDALQKTSAKLWHLIEKNTTDVREPLSTPS